MPVPTGVSLFIIILNHTGFANIFQKALDKGSMYVITLQR